MPIGCSGPTSTANYANCAYSIATDVGSYTGSASPNGTFDQGGNVWEWNEEQVSGSNRGLRGGAWTSPARNDLAAAFWISNGPAGSFPNLGFRVASVPEPSTGLLVLSGLAGLTLRRRLRD